MVRPFRLNGQAIKHARLSDRQVADVDHLLHFAFAFADDFPGFESDELAELVLQIAQGVAQTAHSFAADRSWRKPPFQKCLVRASDRRFVIFIGSGANAGQFSPIDR